MCLGDIAELKVPGEAGPALSALTSYLWSIQQRGPRVTAQAGLSPHPHPSLSRMPPPPGASACVAQTHILFFAGAVTLEWNLGNLPGSGLLSALSGPPLLRGSVPAAGSYVPQSQPQQAGSRPPSHLQSEGHSSLTLGHSAQPSPSLHLTSSQEG